MEQQNNFLHKKLPDLQKSEEVQDAVTKHTNITGEKVPNNPEARLGVYMERLENIFLNDDEETRKRNIEMLRDKIHEAFVIKPEDVPESYFELQKRVARERGQAVEEIPQETRQQMIAVIIEDQKHSLDSWIDYLSSNDAMYPTWFKYFVFRNITKLSQFDKDLGKFKERTKATTAPFPDIYREALAQVSDLYTSAQRDKELFKDKDFQEFLAKKFPTQYADKIQQTLEHSQEAKEQIAGEWIKYTQGDENEAIKLYKSLENKGTGWCTAGMSTAETQIGSGDFYVYYSYDKENKPTQPRLAIRMEGKDRIGEVRGVLPHQEVESNLQEILDTKLSSFGSEADSYKKKSSDMKHLTFISKELEEKGVLSKSDILFLFEASEKIEGFGYDRDPRIDELRAKITKENIINVLELKPEEVAFSTEEVTDTTVLYYPKVSYFLSNEKKKLSHNQFLESLKTVRRIYSKAKNKETLSKDELEMLYKLNNNDIAPSFETHEERMRFEDEQMKELKIIKEQRNLKEDLGVIFDCSPENVIDDLSQINGHTKIFIEPRKWRDLGGDHEELKIYDLTDRKNLQTRVILIKIENLLEKIAGGDLLSKEDLKFIWMGTVTKDDHPDVMTSFGGTTNITLYPMEGYSNKTLYPFNKIREGRDMKDDYAVIWGYKPDEIIDDFKDIKETTKGYFTQERGMSGYIIEKISEAQALSLSEINRKIKENNSLASIAFEMGHGSTDITVPHEFLKDVSSALEHFFIEDLSSDENYERVLPPEVKSLSFDQPTQASFSAFFVKYQKEYLETKDILEDLDKIGLRPATFAELLAFGITNPYLIPEDTSVNALGASAIIDNVLCVPVLKPNPTQYYVDGDDNYIPEGENEPLKFEIIDGYMLSHEKTVYLCVHKDNP